jgi:K+-transporting ATPase KdpF subunit
LDIHEQLANTIFFAKDGTAIGCMAPGFESLWIFIDRTFSNSRRNSSPTQRRAATRIDRFGPGSGCENSRGSEASLNAGSDLRHRNDSLLFNRSCVCPRMRKATVRISVMNLETIVGLVASVLLLIYLVYALLRPEKF